MDERDAWRFYRATVIPGKGTKGTKPLESEDSRTEFRAVAGFEKVPGSLNLRADQRIWLRRRVGVRWSRGRMYRGRLGAVAVVFTKAGGIGANPRLFHLYADRHLKTELSLSDGDVVDFGISRAAVSRMPLFEEAVYALRLCRIKAASLRRRPSK